MFQVTSAQLEEFFLKPYTASYPVHAADLSVVVGANEFTPSVTKRAGELESDLMLGSKIFLVGGHPVDRVCYDSSYRLLKAQGYDFEKHPASETESDYMCLYWPDNKPLGLGAPRKVVAGNDTQKNIQEIAAATFALAEDDLKDAAVNNIKILGIVALPWHMNRLMSAFVQERNRLGLDRRVCFMPHLAWPVEAGITAMNWRENADSRRLFGVEHAKIAGANAPYAQKGFYRPVNFVGEQQLLLLARAQKMGCQR